MASGGQIVTATYRVAPERQAEFLDLLRTCEAVMREEGLVTDRPILRMRSKADPSVLVELFEWTDDTAFGRAIGNVRVQACWGKYEAAWIEGGFGMARIPESEESWAQYDAVD